MLCIIKMSYQVNHYRLKQLQDDVNVNLARNKEKLVHLNVWNSKVSFFNYFSDVLFKKCLLLSALPGLTNKPKTCFYHIKICAFNTWGWNPNIAECGLSIYTSGQGSCWPGWPAWLFPDGSSSETACNPERIFHSSSPAGDESWWTPWTFSEQTQKQVKSVTAHATQLAYTEVSYPAMWSRWTQIEIVTKKLHSLRHLRKAICKIYLYVQLRFDILLLH